MKVYKFGGASVKSASAVKNVCEIINKENGELLVVISAMGKITNALEEVVNLAFNKKIISDKIAAIRNYHAEIIHNLFNNPNPVLEKVDSYLLKIEEESSITDYDQLYDQIVSTGELLSTIIVSEYLSTIRQNTWIDARDYIKTDNTYREGKVDWALTKVKTSKLQPNNGPIITQGFIGRSTDGHNTTLGREGSDYSAAIFASCLNAESVTIWKDVPGVMNADPKRLTAATIFDELPFQEAAEMTYYGASVIHPKTIKPLANANIPLLVKNFDDTSLNGTRIHECKINKLPPLIIFKDNQCLISCKVTDYTFVTEDQLSTIFKTLAEQEVKINLMQNSAISFSFCVDYRETKIKKLIEALSKTFEVYYNTNLTLITIKNYSAEISNEYRSKNGILLEQISRSTLQLLIKENELS